MSSSLRAELEAARTDGRTSLVGYLPVAYPTPDRFLELVEGACAAGLDALELGLPVEETDSLTGDGPIIREALATAYAHCDFDEGLELMADVRRRVTVPLVALTYETRLTAAGVDPLLDSCRAAGADAILIPDLTLDEQFEVARKATDRDLDTVVFMSSPDQGHFVAERADPRVVGYLASAPGSTGGQVDPDVVDRRVTTFRELAPVLPLIVGFGVWGAADARAVAKAGADGVAIGTALVQAAAEGTATLNEFVRAASSALRSPETTDGS